MVINLVKCQIRYILVSHLFHISIIIDNKLFAPVTKDLREDQDVYWTRCVDYTEGACTEAEMEFAAAAGDGARP